MNILLIIDALEPGGKERQVLELAKGLSSQVDINMRLIVLSTGSDLPLNEALEDKIIYLKRNSKYDPLIFQKLDNEIRNFMPVLIHSWNLMCSVYVLPTVVLRRIRLINGIIRDAPTKIKKFGKIWLQIRLTFPFSDIILANSHAGLKAYQVENKKGVVIHNGFDRHRIPKFSNFEEVRKKFQIDTKFVVGMIARFSYMKDHETFLTAATNIIRQRDDVTFLAIGDGATLKHLKGKYSPSENPRLKFLGNQKEVESILNILDIGVLSTYTEGISNSIMEYMAFAKPVIATKCGGNEEIVINQETGYLVEPQNPQALINKINHLLDNPTVSNNMGLAGLKRLEKYFSLEKMTSEHLKLYKKCIRG